MTDAPLLTGAQYRALMRLPPPGTCWSPRPAYVGQSQIERLVSDGLVERHPDGAAYRRTALGETRRAATAEAMREGRAPR